MGLWLGRFSGIVCRAVGWCWRRSVGDMVVQGLWALVGLQGPAFASSSSHVVLGLAVFAAALLVVVAAAASGLRIAALPAAVGVRAVARRARVRRLPRL